MVRRAAMLGSGRKCCAGAVHGGKSEHLCIGSDFLELRLAQQKLQWFKELRQEICDFRYAFYAPYSRWLSSPRLMSEGTKNAPSTTPAGSGPADGRRG